MNRKLIETKYLEETYFKLISLHIFYLLHNLDIGELLQHNYWILKITLNVSKELNFLPQTLILSSLYLCNPKSFTLDISNYQFYKSNNLSLKYRCFTSWCYKDIKIRTFEFVTKFFLYFDHYHFLEFNKLSWWTKKS